MEKNIADREINLIDMFWAVCMKWRQMLLWGVVFAILAGGFSYFKSAQEAKKAAEPVEEVALEDIELDEISQRTAEIYLKYVEMYAKQETYNEHAPLMQLEANGFYRSVISYYVDNHFVVEYPLMNKTNNINAIIEAYKAELRSEEFSERLKNISSLDVTMLPYVMELVDSDNSFGTSVAYDSATGVMTISVYGTNEQMCEELSNLVKETIISSKEKVVKQFGEHDISLIEDVCNYEADNELLKYQKDNLDRLATYSNSIKDQKSKLTENELAYVEAYQREQADEIEEADKPSQTAEEAIIPNPAVNIKITVVGFVGGVAMVFFVIVLMYLFNTKLQLEDDFEMIYAIKLLGNVIVHNNDKKRWFAFVDKFFDKMRHRSKHYFDEKEAVPMVAAGIKISMKQLEGTKVYVTGATVGKEEQLVIEKLKKELKESNIEVITGKPILYDAEALEKSSEIGYVLLMERAGVSLYREVLEEIEICAHQGTKVIGAVVVA